jgi:hypothetical protein
LGHTSSPLVGLCVPFWVSLGVPKCPKTAYKIFFLVVLDYFSYENDLVRGLFSSLDIGKCIPPTCGPLGTFLGLFGSAPKEHKNIYFLVFWTISPTRMGLITSSLFLQKLFLFTESDESREMK